MVEQFESSTQICDDEDPTSNHESLSYSDKSDDEPEVAAITHSVVFKCIEKAIPRTACFG